MQLLFCNTFVCDSTTASSGNWAVVKFPCMIAVDEVWIIPPGVKAHSQLHDDQYVGKTLPSNFRIEFFSDDRSASMTTYEHVGSMEYSEGSPNRFHPASALYSEKLLMNGWFTQITIAVYGGILSDVGASTASAPSLDLNLKAPSLIIHEKPEGRSVYIRGVQNTPQLMRDGDKPEPLMPSLLTSSESEFLLGRAKTYPDLEEDIDLGKIDDLAFPEENMGYDEMQNPRAPYYDRHQPRNRGFGRRNYVNDRSDYSRNAAREAIQNIDAGLGFRTASSERPYRDRNRGIPISHQHGRHENIGNSDLSNQRYIRRNDREQNDNKRDARVSNDSNEVEDLRHSLERNREEHSASEEMDKERNQDWIEEYEEISDEDIEEERVAALQAMEDILDVDLLTPESTMCFNPFSMEPIHLMHFSHPDMTDFEISCNSLLLQQDDENAPQNGLDDIDVARFESLITKASRIGKLENTNSDCPTLILTADQGKAWVSVIEEFIPLISTALPVFAVTSREKYQEYLTLLLVWVFTGLNNALSSSQAIGTNLRMLKCGINLAHKLCLTTQEIVASLTASRLDDKLVALLCMDNMASSIKILIIHSLDAYFSWPTSLNMYFSEEDVLSSNHNYICLVDLMLKPQAARVATALSRLMNKISLFHSMWRLKHAVHILVTEKIPNAEDEYDLNDDYLADAESDVVEEEVVLEEEMVVMSSTSNDEEEEEHTFRRVELDERNAKVISTEYSGQGRATETENESSVFPHTPPPENTTISLDAAMCVHDATLTYNDVLEIVQCLNLLTHTLQNIKFTITQLPKRTFPTVSNQSEVADKQTLACFFRMLEFYQVLSSVQALLCIPIISGIQEVYDATYKFLDFLMSSQDGILFLSSNFSTVRCIIRHLLCSTSNLSTATVEIAGTAPHLGVKLAIHIQCMQCIDQLNSVPEAEMVDELARLEDSVDIMKVLYSLTFPTFGKYWIAKIFSFEDNLLALLSCIQHSKSVIEEADPGDNNGETKEENQEKTKKKPPKKSASSGYAVNILLTCVKMSGSVHHLLKHQDMIMSTIQAAPSGRYVEEVHEWLRPLESLAGGKENIIKCMHFLKAGFDKLEWNTLMTSGPGICTALRLLCNLIGVKAPSKDDSYKDVKVETQSYCTALQVFSGGGLTVLTDGIEQLTKCFTYPCYSQHALTTVLSFNFHCLIVNLSVSLLELVYHLLNVLLSTPEGKYQPENLTKLLVHFYAGVYVALRESSIEQLDVITELVVAILGIFIKNKQENDDQDDQKKIISEIISGMQESCQFMVPGMIILSHMLPLPLPVAFNDEDLEDDAVKAILTCRSSWEEPLNHVSGELTSFIFTACHSKCLPLLEVLIPVIQQIADLSPNLATTFVGTVVDSCVTVSKETEANGNSEDKEERKMDEVMFHSHQLLVLSEIVSQPSAKAALLSIMGDNQNQTFNTLWKAAQNTDLKNKSRIVEATLKLASILLDTENDLVSKSMINECAFQEHVVDILSIAAESLASPYLQTVLNALFCLIAASSSDFLFKELRSLLIKHQSVNNILETINKRWPKETVLSITTLLHFCYFIKCLLNPNNERPSFFTKAEIKSILKWNKEFSGTHILMVLKLRLQETELDDEITNQALDEVTVLCQSLKISQSFSSDRKGDKHKTEKKDANESFSLENVYKGRFVTTYKHDDGVFASRLAILKGNAENSFSTKDTQVKERETVNLIDISDKFCGGFSLEKSLKELTESAKTTDIDKVRTEAKAKRLKKLETFSTRHGKTLTFIKRSHGLLSTVPRGRGRGRGGLSGRHYDLFRQRKQNTSRPPSMHVDDFVAADEEDGGDAPASELPPQPSYPLPRRMGRPFKRDFIPRGRGRGTNRSLGPGRGGFTTFTGTGANTEPLSAADKFRTRSLTTRLPERFSRGRGRARDLPRTFSPRDNFKAKPQQSWGFTPKNFGGNFNSSSGYRGGRGRALMRGRPLMPHPHFGFNKWGVSSPRRGRGYSRPRGKHIRSFTR